MTDPSTISPEQAAAASPGQAAIEVTRQFFKFASDHYVIFSALTIIAVVFVCTVFTFGYLSVFYWRLILVLEYNGRVEGGVCRCRDLFDARRVPFRADLGACGVMQPARREQSRTE